MNTQRPLILGALGLASVVLATSLYDWHNGLEILSAQTATADGIRIAVMMLLTILLFTKVPRHMFVRLVLGSMGISLAALTFYLVMTYQASIIDAILLMIVSIISFIAALEVRYTKIPVSTSPSRPVRITVQ